MSKQNITTYDDAFRTLLAACPSLIIPVVNELFGTDYAPDEEVILRQNERFLNTGMERKKRVTDAYFSIRDKDYHLEVQSTSDNTIAFRMIEYDMMLAMERVKEAGENIRIVFPNSGVIYLRKSIKAPEKICITFDTPGGVTSYECKVLRIADYSLDEIFEKRLYFFIPFFLFVYEDRFKEYNENGKMLDELSMTYDSLRDRLFKALHDEGYGSHIYDLFVELIGSVADKLASKYANVKEGTVGPMYGNILETKTMKAYNMQMEAEAKMAEADKKLLEADKKASEADKKASEADKKASEADKKASEADKKTSEAERRALEEKEKSIGILIELFSKEGRNREDIVSILKEKYDIDNEKIDALLEKYWR